MQSRFQIVYTLAIIACFVCMAFARPAASEDSVVPASMIKTPRLNSLLMRRADADYDTPVDTPMKPYNTAGEPTREEALAKNGGTADYKFNITYANTNPMQDAQTKLAELNKTAEKEKKKAEKKKDA